MKLSIIIPTLNRVDDLSRTLDYLEHQSFQDFEILVIDQSDLPKKWEGHRIRYFPIPFKSASKARNLGLVEAKGDIVLFLDDDIIIENHHFLELHIKHYHDLKVSGVVGSILPLDRKKEMVLSVKATNLNWGWMYFPPNYGVKTHVPNGGSGNLSVRRNWALDIGGMDERFEKGAFREETEFCLRYTLKYGLLVYDPEASIVHLGSPRGGSRSWELITGVIHGYQHMFGGWYLMFKRLNTRFWPRYIYSLLRRFLLHKKLLIRIYLMPVALFYFMRAFFSAWYFSMKPPLLIDKSNK